MHFWGKEGSESSFPLLTPMGRFLNFRLSDLENEEKRKSRWVYQLVVIFSDSNDAYTARVMETFHEPRAEANDQKGSGRTY